METESDLATSIGPRDGAAHVTATSTVTLTRSGGNLRLSRQLLFVNHYYIPQVAAPPAFAVRTFTWLVLLAGCIVAGAGAQAPRAFAAIRDLHIDAATADFSQAGTLLVSRSGAIIVIDDKDNIFRTFDGSGSTGTIGRVGEGPGEFRNLRNAGWIGDSLWTIDPSLKRISIFGPDRKFVRSFPEPSTIVPPNAAADSSEKVSEVYVQAVLSDGSLRAIAGLRPTHRPSWAADIDSGYTLYVQISPTGILQRRIAVAPPNRCLVNFTMRGGSGGTHIPFCAERVSTDWNGSELVASADADSTSVNRPGYRVTVLAENGTVRFSRIYPLAPVPVSPAARDSSLAARTKALARFGPAFIQAMPKVVPARNWPPVRRILVGRDATVWVEERVASPGHLWRILDFKGTVLGTLALPENIALRAADLHAAWGYETDADGLQGLVRYHLH